MERKMGEMERENAEIKKKMEKMEREKEIKGRKYEQDKLRRIKKKRTK